MVARKLANAVICLDIKCLSCSDGLAAIGYPTRVDSKVDPLISSTAGEYGRRGIFMPRVRAWPSRRSLNNSVGANASFSEQDQDGEGSPRLEGERRQVRTSSAQA